MNQIYAVDFGSYDSIIYAGTYYNIRQHQLVSNPSYQYYIQYEIYYVINIVQGYYSKKRKEYSTITQESYLFHFHIHLPLM